MYIVLYAVSLFSCLHTYCNRLESLFYKYGVDVILEAHEHIYERLWPVYNEQVTANDYNNPKAPVHFISGTPGCNDADGECIDPTLGPKGQPREFNPFLSCEPLLYTSCIVR